ncbi:MAG: hypothetical protein ACTSX6_04825 [Candidatus Heimdallarchaeaceae archaeon]
MAFPDAWGPLFLMSITKKGGSQIEIAQIVDPDSISIDRPKFESEWMPNGAGGYIRKDPVATEGTLTFDIWDIELDTTSGVGLVQQFSGGTWNDTEPLALDTSWPASVTRTRDTFMVNILFTNDPAATTAAGTTAASTDSRRFYCKDAVFISYDTKMDGGLKKTTVTIKFPHMDKAGTTQLWADESGDQTALTANTYS